MDYNDYKNMMQQEFQLFKQEIEEKIINELLNYIKDGTLPKANEILICISMI